MSEVSEVKKCPKCEEERVSERRLLAWGFGPRVFAYRCKDCGYIEL